MLEFIKSVIGAMRSVVDALLFQHRRPPGFD